MEVRGFGIEKGECFGGLRNAAATSSSATTRATAFCQPAQQQAERVESFCQEKPASNGLSYTVAEF